MARWRREMRLLIAALEFIEAVGERTSLALILLALLALGSSERVLSYQELMLRLDTYDACGSGCDSASIQTLAKLQVVTR